MATWIVLDMATVHNSVVKYESSVWLKPQTSKKERLINGPTSCIVCLVCTVGGCHKNALGRGSASSGQITKLKQSTFLQISMAEALTNVGARA